MFKYQRVHLLNILTVQLALEVLDQHGGVFQQSPSSRWQLRWSHGGQLGLGAGDRTLQVGGNLAVLLRVPHLYDTHYVNITIGTAF